MAGMRVLTDIIFMVDDGMEGHTGVLQVPLWGLNIVCSLVGFNEALKASLKHRAMGQCALLTWNRKQDEGKKKKKSLTSSPFFSLTLAPVCMLSRTSPPRPCVNAALPFLCWRGLFQFSVVERTSGYWSPFCQSLQISIKFLDPCSFPWPQFAFRIVLSFDSSWTHDFRCTLSTLALPSFPS